MTSRRFSRELAARLPDWQQRGWISPETAVAMRAAYDLDRAPLRLGPIILGILGSVLLLGGVILIFAHNWDDLARPVRAVIGLLPLLTCIGLGYWVLRKRPHSIAWSEGLALATSLAICSAISLFAQTYQISGDYPRFILTWALFTLAAAYLLGGTIAWVLFQVLASIWAWHVQEHHAIFPGYGLLVLASIPFLLPEIWGARRALSSRTLQLPLFLCISATVCAPLRDLHGSGWTLSVLTAWFALAFLYADGPERPAGAATRILAALSLSVMLTIFSFKHMWGDLTFDSLNWLTGRPSEFFTPATVYLVIIHGSLAAMIVYRRRVLDAASWLWAAAGFLGFASFLFDAYSLDALTGMVGANLLAAAVALTTMGLGLRQRNPLRTNLGWLLFAVLVLCRFFDSDLGFLPRGIAFIGVGLGFLGLNHFMTKTRRAADDIPAPQA